MNFIKILVNKTIKVVIHHQFIAQKKSEKNYILSLFYII